MAVGGTAVVDNEKPASTSSTPAARIAASTSFLFAAPVIGEDQSGLSQRLRTFGIG